MNRRTLLVALSAGLAGCGGGGGTGSSPTSTETGTNTETATDTETQTATSTSTPEAKPPAIRSSSVTPEREYQGDSLPKGALLNVAVEFDVWAHDGTAEAEVSIDFESVPVSDATETVTLEPTGEGLVVDTYETEISTSGWPAGGHVMQISVKDTIGEMSATPAEHPIRIADYTQTEYTDLSATVDELADRVDDVAIAFRREGGQSLTAIVPGGDFELGPVLESANSVYWDAGDALEQGVDPFEDRLQRIEHRAQVMRRAIQAQIAVGNAQNALIANVDYLREHDNLAIHDQLEDVESRLSEVSTRIEEVEDVYREDGEYMLDYDEKIDALWQDRSNIESFTSIVEDLTDASVLLGDAENAKDDSNYTRAESLAIDASGGFEDGLDDLEDVSGLPETVDAFTEVAEELLETAQDLRQEMAQEQE